MKAIKIGTIARTAEHKRMFERKGFKMTGDTLVIESNPYKEVGGLPTKTTYVVFTGKYTPYETVRDCGDHFIHAGYSSYTRIDKETLAITYDVEDR